MFRLTSGAPEQAWERASPFYADLTDPATLLALSQATFPTKAPPATAAAAAAAVGGAAAAPIAAGRGPAAGASGGMAGLDDGAGACGLLGGEEPLASALQRLLAAYPADDDTFGEEPYRHAGRYRLRQPVHCGPVVRALTQWQRSRWPSFL